MNLREGENIDLVCRAVGRPMPHITWYHERQQVSLDKHIKLNDVDETTDCQNSVLSVTDLVPAKHGGKYTMEAVNAVGSCKHSIILSGWLSICKVYCSI